MRDEERFHVRPILETGHGSLEHVLFFRLAQVLFRIPSVFDALLFLGPGNITELGKIQEINGGIVRDVRVTRSNMLTSTRGIGAIVATVG